MRICCLVFLCLGLVAQVFAMGKSAAKTRTPLNTDWTLCLTQFDVSALPENKAPFGRVLARSLVRHLNGLEFKLRQIPEYDYYWEAAWLKNQSDISKKIIDKQAQRDKLIYQGEPLWRTRRQQKNLDREINGLQTELDEAEISSPYILESPKFLVTSDNRDNVFPAQPVPGSEYYLCSAQKADALLLGRLSEYHGRILVELQLWSMWARAVSWKDTLIFSIEDVDLALSEFSARLMQVISGMVPASITVTATPDNAVIIIDDYHAGRGKSETIERTPGDVTVTVYAENYVTTTETINIAEGEQVEMEVALKPLPVESYTINTVPEDGAKVYTGALFAGTSPQQQTAPLGKTIPINVETEDGKIAQSIFTIQAPDSLVTLKPALPPASDRTEKARRGFYGALGRLWIAGPLAFLIVGYSNIYADSVNVAPLRTTEHFQTAQMWYQISTGSLIVAGISLLEVITRLGIYLYQGSKETPIIMPKEKPQEITETPAAMPVNAEDGEDENGNGAGNDINDENGTGLETPL